MDCYLLVVFPSSRSLLFTLILFWKQSLQCRNLFRETLTVTSTLAGKAQLVMLAWQGSLPKASTEPPQCTRHSSKGSPGERKHSGQISPGLTHLDTAPLLPKRWEGGRERERRAERYWGIFLYHSPPYFKFIYPFVLLGVRQRSEDNFQEVDSVLPGFQGSSSDGGHLYQLQVSRL